MTSTNFDIDCPHCGSQTIPGVQFCARCGGRLAEVEAGAVSEAAGANGTAVDTEGPPWSVTFVTAGLFLFLGVLVAAAFIGGAVGSLLPEYELAVKTLVGIHVLALGIGAIVWLLGARMSSSPLAALGLGAPSIPVGVAGVLTVAALAASMLVTFVYGFAVDRLGLEFLRPPEINDEILFPGVGALLTFQALVLVTPFSEELLFRGFALRGLLRSIGPGPAVVASALVFAALHLEPGSMIPIFFTGLFLGSLYVRTGSLWPCIAAHAGQNCIALLATQFL